MLLSTYYYASIICQGLPVTHWVSATEDAVLVQSGAKALVCCSISVTVLPREKEVKAPHDGVVPLIRKLLTIAVELTSIKNTERS